MNYMTQKSLSIFLSLSLSLVILQRANAQKVGDRVVVTANFDTKIHKEVVGKVFEGEIHSVIAINGKWCSLDNVKGWLPLQYVMNLDTAKKHYDKRIKSQPQDADAFAHRGLIHYEQENFAKAFSDLNASLRINQRNPVTWSNRGMVLNAQQKFPLAIKDLEYAIKLNPNFSARTF
jgi:tetratricopeptide (TPR) repeat protein